MIVVNLGGVMGFRFQKRIKLMPGVVINASKSGLSTSIGHKGARITLGHGKTRTTVGLPGSGLSHTAITSNSAEPGSPSGPSVRVGLWGIVLVMVLIVVIALALKN